MKILKLTFFGIFLVCIVFLAQTGFAVSAQAKSETRDPLKWPYTQNSIWNMPIGHGAKYVPANLSSDPGGLIAKGGNKVWVGIGRIDTEFMVFTPDAPLTDVYLQLKPWDKPGDPNDRCLYDSTKPRLAQVRVPANYIYPNDDQNAIGVFLKGDGRTIQQMAPIARCQAGGPVTTHWYPAFDSDIYTSDGIRGGRGGSGMSAIGGSIRIGELRPGQVGMRHALKLTVYDKEALYNCTKSKWNDYTSDCFRWPAITSDDGLGNIYGTANNNQNKAMVMGSLLAIPTLGKPGGKNIINRQCTNAERSNASKLCLETEPARQLAWTLQNYGAYIVDTTPGPEIYLAGESGFPGQPSLASQFKSDWGYNFEQGWWDKSNPSPWMSDIRKLIEALYVVDNNSPSSIGGGGATLQHLAPPFGSPAPGSPPPATTPPASPLPEESTASPSSCGAGSAKATGLVSAPDVTNFNSSGACVKDSRASFAPYKIPVYEDLKSLYFDQSRSTRKSTYSGNANQGNISSLIQSTDTDRSISVDGNLTITGNGFLNGKPTIPVVIFVRDDLTINNDISYARTAPNGGLVFVVKGNVNIDKDVTQIDAVIISTGKIYTAGAGCSHNASSLVTANQLTINGSLISLNESNPIEFCRTLSSSNRTTPAEIINNKPKYLVILRNLFADNRQRWSEIQ